MTRIAIAAFALLVSLVVFYLLIGMAFVIDFGAPTRPTWASIALLIIDVAIPFGVAFVLLLRIAELLQANKLAQASSYVGGILMCPVAGWLAGMGLLRVGILP